jgi:hypothetical protein
MPSIALTNTVTSILRQPGLAKLAFNLGGLEVTGSKLGSVADAIAAGKIKCLTVTEFVSQGKNELAAGMTVAARYEIKKNAMVFEKESYGSSPGEDRTIVHEAVHAIFDLNAGPKGKQNLAVDDEAAAVLTEAFYIRLCNKPVGGFKMMVDGPQEHALNLADEVLIETDNFVAKPGTYMLRPDQLESLRAAVAKDWNFTTFVGKDGLPTDNRNLKYVYDGVPKCPGGKSCR